MKINSLCRKKIPAFNFIELLFVLCLIGILIFLALPELKPLLVKARSIEAQSQLKYVRTLEESYYYMKYKYSSSLEEIGFEHSKLATDGGNAYYKIEITEASANSFRARATAIVDFDGDGAFNVWEIDHEMNLVEIIKD